VYDKEKPEFGLVVIDVEGYGPDADGECRIQVILDRQDIVGRREFRKCRLVAGVKPDG